jgi:hypothetical protein
MAKFLVDDETGEEVEIVKARDLEVWEDEDGNEYFVFDEEDEA